ncbi:putative NADPH-quinone reductase [Panacagrimonas perspica]|uniref:Putative NADPH-quinone reductase n=1 Tax=Panacagrimonas perspica TaxID=381431 RepID=A0A4R7PC62_9GAMM|nr:NAD(P)H-dependent oxidoreductase [Panacagrimonas perspica]TDU31663.1 putative NADPH-quinone reductase [Panacagrimonas perspica]THD03117.1 dehydrogenase [Panacagrimonas perspica]
MTHRIAVIQGHPDVSPCHLGHALADAYISGAIEKGHQVREVVVAEIDFPIVRSKAEWELDDVPESIRLAQDTIRWASHVLILHPLWLGSMPALLKAFLEQVFRPGFALTRRDGRWERLLRGRSAHVVVTMGMPALVFRWFFFAHGVRSLVRNVLRISGFSPVRTTLVGSVENAGNRHRQKWLTRMRREGQFAR